MTERFLQQVSIHTSFIPMFLTEKQKFTLQLVHLLNELSFKMIKTLSTCLAKAELSKTNVDTIR